MTNALRHFFLALPTKLQEEDKGRHMAWSFWLTLAALVLWPAPLAFTAVFVLGLGKECWDFRYGTGFCLFDMVGNLIGILAGQGVGYLFGLALAAWV